MRFDAGGRGERRLRAWVDFGLALWVADPSADSVGPSLGVGSTLAGLREDASSVNAFDSSVVGGFGLRLAGRRRRLAADLGLGSSIPSVIQISSHDAGFIM
ncbi:MAG TPA: hypothetical protein VI541_02540 [Actinomycetota bacterium]|nr:hypothetical protein [Actinomycetota bacterium]